MLYRMKRHLAQQKHILWGVADVFPNCFLLGVDMLLSDFGRNLTPGLKVFVNCFYHFLIELFRGKLYKTKVSHL